MATKQFNSRIQWKKDTSANWTQNNPVLLNGVLVLILLYHFKMNFYKPLLQK